MKRIATIAALTALAVAVLAPSARAEQAHVTRGNFDAFAAGLTTLAGLYGDLDGRAQMVRTANDQTIVTVHVTGLLPDTAYGSHVHKQACNDGDAGGHYKHDPSGIATPPNEIWPAFTTNADGIGAGNAVAEWRAGSTAISVVVHAPGGAKIGCADLA